MTTRRPVLVFCGDVDPPRGNYFLLPAIYYPKTFFQLLDVRTKCLVQFSFLLEVVSEIANTSCIL
jgi:hypothetical protein